MDYHFEAHLTARDCKRYIPHEFVVPAGCERIDIEFVYAPQRVQGVKNLLTLTVFDPHGFRGARHRSGTAHHVTLRATEGTPGYFPGPLMPERIVELIRTRSCRAKLSPTRSM